MTGYQNFDSNRRPEQVRESSASERPSCKIDYEVYWLHHEELTEKLAVALAQKAGCSASVVALSAFDMATEILQLHGIEPKPYVPPDKRRSTSQKEEK